jgi:thiamine biosynthesis lipoprotein
MRQNRVLLALDAMATRFELVLEGDGPVRLRAAGEDALREIERLDARLSRFRPASQISAVNARAARSPVRVDVEVLSLLQSCLDVSAGSDGAFDIGVGALVDLWRAAGRAGRPPDAASLAETQAASGVRHVVIDETASSVRFRCHGVSLDLGAAGKGYAVDRAIDCLRDAGIAHALLHGGTSSIQAIGPQANGRPWPITWTPAGNRVTFALTDGALSISATHGREFTAGGRTYGHVLDPRTGEPIPSRRAGAVRGPSSFVCDMLSTALLVRGAGWLDQMHARWPEYTGHVWPVVPSL